MRILFTIPITTNQKTTMKKLIIQTLKAILGYLEKPKYRVIVRTHSNGDISEFHIRNK